MALGGTRRLYALRYVTPIASELIRKLAVDQPADLNGYVIGFLTDYVAKEAAANAATATEAAAAQASDPASAVEIRNLNILVLGLDGAGKSTLLATLQGDKDPSIMSTTGFRPVQMVMEGGVKVRFYDVGGGPKIRDIWSSYYHDVHGVIYVLDGAENSRWQEGLELLRLTVRHPYLAAKPLLVLVNKQDAAEARSPGEVRREIGPIQQDEGGRGVMAVVHGCIAHTPHNEDVVDPRIDVSLQGLFDRIRTEYAEIEARVQRDTDEVRLLSRSGAAFGVAERRLLWRRWGRRTRGRRPQRTVTYSRA